MFDSEKVLEQMKNLMNKEKNAIIRILKDIIFADGIVDQREMKLLEKIEENLGVSELSDNEVDKMSSLSALAVVRELPLDIKVEFAKMMGDMIVVDNDINYKEVEMYNLVIDTCDIPYSFKEEEPFTFVEGGDVIYEDTLQELN